MHWILKGRCIVSGAARGESSRGGKQHEQRRAVWKEAAGRATGWARSREQQEVRWEVRLGSMGEATLKAKLGHLDGIQWVLGRPGGYGAG